MQIEIENLKGEQPLARPPDIARSMILQYDHGPSEVVAKVKEVWLIVSSWGLWREDLIGAPFPSPADAERLLPAWFTKKARASGEYTMANFMLCIESRDWIVWRISILRGLIKADLNAFSFPIESSALRCVFECAGAKFLFCDLWWSDAEVNGSDPSSIHPKPFSFDDVSEQE